jgi:hypothetical protein
VEVFADADAATSRRTYIQQLGKGAAFLSEYDFQSGPILLRGSRQLTPHQAGEYESALRAFADHDGSPAPAAVPVPTPAAPVAPPAAQLPGAEPAIISVARVHDAATVVLTDGTRLRQVGISAPNPNTCQAKQASAAADAEAHRAALTYQLLGQSDVYGNQWAYLQVGGVDLGEKLASLGWVWAYPDSPASQSYNQRIANNLDSARRSKAGQFAAELLRSRRACSRASAASAASCPRPGRQTGKRHRRRRHLRGGRGYRARYLPHPWPVRGRCRQDVLLDQTQGHLRRSRIGHRHEHLPRPNHSDDQSVRRRIRVTRLQPMGASGLKPAFA